MDHPLFIPYAATNGLPQESKLATYMNRQSAGTPVSNLNQAFSKINIDSPVTSKKVSPESPAFVPGLRPSATGASSPYGLTYGAGGQVGGPPSSASPHLTPQPSPPPMNNCSPVPTPLQQLEKPIGTVAYQENVGGTTYFYPTTSPSSTITPSSSDSISSTHLNNQHHHSQHQQQQAQQQVAQVLAPLVAHQMYPGTPAHIASMRDRVGGAAGAAASAFFISEEAHEELLQRNALTLVQCDPEEYPDLPHEVEHYHDLYPLEPIVMHKAHMGYQASMYKATNIKTGVRYCLRRIHGFRLQNAKCMQFVDMWKKLIHSNIVQLKEVFTTKAFGDTSMVFVYDYHPASETLLSRHFTADPLNGGSGAYADPFATDPSAPRPYSHQKNHILRHQQAHKLPEPLIWNYIIQLTSALRIIHSAGLACRSLDPTKIILTSGSRLRLSCLGVLDVIVGDAGSAAAGGQVALLQHYQQEDLSALGKLVLALGCKSTMAVQPGNITTAVEVVGRTYTNDLRNLLMYLLSNQQRRSVTDLMPMIGARFYTQLDCIQSRADLLEDEVCKEMENGRLFRVMVKLATINERPEFNMGGAWSETGDRYMLKLFRDYVFHQVTEDGHAWLDMAHVVHCLNKLDAGVPEKVCLMSRDEQSILVVSYAELKHCLEQSFEELVSDSAPVPLDGAVPIVDHNT